MRPRYKPAFIVLSISALLLLVGCERAPSVSVAGSFFPAWLLCVAIGIPLTVAFYSLLVKFGLDEEFKPAIVVYPCLAAGYTFTLWLIFLR